MTVPRISLIGTVIATLGLGMLAAVSAPAASAVSTVTTTQIDCGSSPSTVTVGTALATGDTLAVSYINCNGFNLTWSHFSSGPGASPYRENGNNAETRNLTGYDGNVAGGSALATLTKTTGGTTTTVSILQAVSTAWVAKSPTGSGVVGTAYSSYTFNAGLSGTTTYSLGSGTLPSGLSLVGSTGVLSGTPTRIGSYTFNIGATNGTTTTTTGDLTVVVSGPTVDKVTICHRTRATTNPYVLITVSVNSVIGSGGSNGHDDHNTTRTNKVNPTTNGITPGSGPFDTTFSYPANRKWWGDIIPPFTYSGGTYAGLNWSSDWNSPNPSGGTSTWIEDAEFATAISGAAGVNTSSKYYLAAAKCMNLGTGAQSPESAAMDTPDKYFKVSINNGEDPDTVKGDLDDLHSESANFASIPSLGSLETTFSTNSPVQTDPATGVTKTKATLNGRLKSGSTWTSWKYQWGTSTTEVSDGTNEHTYGGSDPSSSVGTGETRPEYDVTDLTCGTTYYFRIIGNDGTSLQYGLIESFTTNACPGGGSAPSSPTVTPTVTPTPSTRPTPGRGRPPVLTIPTPSASPTPAGPSTPTPSGGTTTPVTTPPTTPPSPEPKSFTPTKTVPPPAGTDWDPTQTRIADPKTGEPVLEVTTPQGTWSVDPTGEVVFTPAKNFTGVATIKVVLKARTGYLALSPLQTRISTPSRVLVLAGDVPRDVSGGVAFIRR